MNTLKVKFENDDVVTIENVFSFSMFNNTFTVGTTVDGEKVYRNFLNVVEFYLI